MWMTIKLHRNRNPEWMMEKSEYGSSSSCKKARQNCVIRVGNFYLCKKKNRMKECVQFLTEVKIGLAHIQRKKYICLCNVACCAGESHVNEFFLLLLIVRISYLVRWSADTHAITFGRMMKALFLNFIVSFISREVIQRWKDYLTHST